MKSHKILFLLHLPPPVHGSSMVGKWIKDSKLLNKTFTSDYINLLASKKVSNSGKVTLSKIFGMFLISYKLVKKLITQRPNTCYIALTTTGAAFYRDTLLVAILRVFRVQRIYHLHNKGVAKASKNKINKVFYRFVFKNAWIILLSEKLYDDVKDFVPVHKKFICPNGISKNVQFNNEIKNKHKNKIPTVLFLSNLIESKGVYILLEALSKLKKMDIKFKGIFVGGEGDISATSFNKKLKDLQLDTQVQYLGKKFDREKNNIFNKADIFAFPTFYPNECFPLVLLEAMQHSLPVISTYEGGIPDIIDNDKTGFLVDQKSISQLTEKLQKLILNNDLVFSMGKKAKDKFEENYTLKIFENNLKEILEKVILT